MHATNSLIVGLSSSLLQTDPTTMQHNTGAWHSVCFSFPYCWQSIFWMVVLTTHIVVLILLKVTGTIGGWCHNVNAFLMLPQTVWSLYSLWAMTLMCCFATLNYCFLWGDWGWGDTPNDASSNAMPPHHKSFNSPLTLALALTLFPCHNTTGHCAIHASIFLPQHFLRNYCSSLANILQLVKEAKRSFVIF